MQSPEDAYKLRIASDLSVNDGFVVFTITWIENGEYESSIYRFDGETLDRLTFGNHERMPLYHDGSLYYISYSKDRERLIKLEPLKEPREIYWNRSITKYQPSSKGVLAIVSDPFDPNDPLATERIKYRFDSRGFLRKKNKLVLIGEKTETLVEGDFDVTDVSSQGEKIIFSSTENDDDHELHDIYSLDADSKAISRITEGSGNVSAICLSPEGRVAYVGHRRGYIPWAVDKLMFPETDTAVEIGMNASSSVLSDLFVSDAQKLLYDSGKYYLIGQTGGSASIFSYDGTVERVTDLGLAVREFSVKSGKLAYVYTSPEKPSVIFFGKELDLNPEIKGATPHRLELEGKDAWLLLSDRKSPNVLSIHGGPHSAYGYAYSIEFNFLVQNGFNVIFGNPAGSGGYGEDFARECVGDWCGKDFNDQMSFMEKAKAKYSLEGPFAVTGGSYGGFMINAIITKTDIFRCAIPERSISNLMSMCGTSDIGFYFNPLELGVEDPWSSEGIERLMQLSPIYNVKKVRTPTMFVEGEEDYRCPIEQAEQMYTALRVMGVPSMLVRYQGDSHEHARRGKPKNMLDRLDRKLKWFKKYCV